MQNDRSPKKIFAEEREILRICGERGHKGFERMRQREKIVLGRNYKEYWRGLFNYKGEGGVFLERENFVAKATDLRKSFLEGI